METTSNELKKSILDLIKELILNLEINKKIYEFLFQKLANLYMKKEILTSDKFYSCLVLLNTILGETMNHLKPRNYFSCSGEGKFEMRFNNKVEVGNCLTLIMNFKIGVCKSADEDPNSGQISNLVTLNFSHGQNIQFDLKYPFFFIVKKIRDSFISTLPNNEWINLIICIVIGVNPIIYFFVNGENRLTPFKIQNTKISCDDYIQSISFFENFYGEVSSISMFSQKEIGSPAILTTDFLSEFKQFKEGIWKRKRFDAFVTLTKSVESLNTDLKKTGSLKKKFVNYQTNDPDDAKITPKTLFDNLVFIFTPFNYTNSHPGRIENCLPSSNLFLNFNGNIRNHKFQVYQKKLSLVKVITNFFPISEIFLLHPEIANEINLEMYFKILENILKFRRHNMEAIKDCKLFRILSLFMEKYPKNLYTDRIVNALLEIARCMFTNNFESLCSNFFNYILLNEKIFSKYSEELQIKLWNYVLLFCQSDSTQIEKFINMNRICLILRFYDKNKYTEMCCSKHLKIIKKEFVGSNKIMNPSMTRKLEPIKRIMDVTIQELEAKNSFLLFKLLTLDLSPCLVKFILNIFIKALQKPMENSKWKNEFVDELLKHNYEIIIANTLIHSILEIRIDILKFLYEIHKIMVTRDPKYFTKMEKMLKNCLLPQKMFYASKDEISKKEESTINETNENILIFEDELYEEYKNQLYDIFTFWALGISPEQKNSSIDLKNAKLKYTNILEIFFSLVDSINNSKYTLFFIQFLKELSQNGQNAYTFLLNKDTLIWTLNIAFKTYGNTEKIDNNCFNETKSIIINIFNNATTYLEKTRVLYPCDEIDDIFLWGNKMMVNKESDQIFKNKLFNFINELLLEFLTLFKVRFEPQMKFNSDFNPKSNFFLKNYLLVLSYLYRFIFEFDLDNKIHSNWESCICHSEKAIDLIKLYASSMRLDNTKGEKINQRWLDYPLFDEIYKRVSYMWEKNNTFKGKVKENKNKLEKYEEILKKIILDKSAKNIYLKELIILCYEEKNNEQRQLILPLLRTVPISLMCIILNSLNNPEVKHWIKEFKYFTRYLIIATCNLTRKEQLELYTEIQEKCINTLFGCLCFWENISSINSPFQEKIKTSFKRILMFSLMITKYQYNYNLGHLGHKLKLNNFLKKLSRNDLISSAIFIMFSEKVKLKNGSPLFPREKLEKMKSINDYDTLYSNVEGKEWQEALFNNAIIKEIINDNFFTLYEYKPFVINRYNLLGMLIDDKYIEKYCDDILVLLPLYENELAKYSNNSLESNKKLKDRYKKYKKDSFTWMGYWSDRTLFFEETDKLKFKLVNHYTTTFMKPLLSPVLDVFYYLPEFSGFDPTTLFNKNTEEDDTNQFRLTMDIDKILKLTEQNLSSNDSITKISDGENYLRSIYIKSNPKLANSLKEISNNLDFGKEEEFAVLKENIDGNKNVQKKYFLCCLVKTSHHIKGVCFIDDEQLNFKVFLNQKTGNAMSGVEVAFKNTDDDYDQERKTCFGSYFVCHPKDKDLYKVSIKYSDIKWIFRRRYYYKNSAIEIFTVNNKSFYLNFKYEEDREAVLGQVASQFTNSAKIVCDTKDPKDIFENVVGYQNNKVMKYHKDEKVKKHIKLSKKLKKWKEWGMSNYEILMWMNLYSNRSFDDISQYPVFPWVLTNYEDPFDLEGNYRNLSLPMGMMELNEEGEKRKELFMETFDVLKNESDGSMKPYIYGSNYSNPMYVCNYLMRLFPFTHISIELQGNKFDDPNRLFLSVKNSFYNSITQKTDVRELIPEFFYLPEMFLNINQLNMGVQENGEKVNDVLTPCQNNPYEFIIAMKNALESEYVSKNLQCWMDLIFGYKAKGKEAENANNLYTEASYQEDVNIASIEDKGSFLRRVEFGLIPNQVMNKECVKRDKKEDIIKDKQIFDQSASLIKSLVKEEDNDEEMIKNLCDTNILDAGFFGDDKLVMVLSNNILLEKKISTSLLDQDFKQEIGNKTDINDGDYMNRISDFYSTNSYSNKAIVLCNGGKAVIVGGFYDGKFKTAKYVPLSNNAKINNFFPFTEDSPILAVEVDKEEEYLFVGNDKGNVAAYKIDIENDTYEQTYQLYDQMSAICNINCNDQLNLWISSSIDGYINLYTLPLCKLIRCIKIPIKTCFYALLSSSPLPCIIAISDDENSEIYVYSINGKFIKKRQENFHLINPIIIKDLYSNEYLAYIEKDVLFILSLPNLEVIVNIDQLRDAFMICPNEDNTILYILTRSWDKVYSIRDENKKGFRGPSFAVKKSLRNPTLLLKKQKK